MLLYTYSFDYNPKTNGVKIRVKTTEVVETALMYRASDDTSRENAWIYKCCSRIKKTETDKVLTNRYNKFKFLIVSKNNNFDEIKEIALKYVIEQITKRKAELDVFELMQKKIEGFNMP